MIAIVNGRFKVQIDRDSSSLTDAELSIVGRDTWKSFCDDFDKAFKAQGISNTLYSSTPFVFLGLFIAGCVTCSIANNHGMYGYHWDDNDAMTWEEQNKMRSTGGGLIGAAFVYLLIVCILGPILSCNAHTKVHRVCDKHSTGRVAFKFSRCLCCRCSARFPLQQERG